MNWPWVAWWLLIFASFAALEGAAFAHPTRMNTLSRTMSLLGAKFPLSIGLIGMFVGGLLVHFFWHFCPFPNGSLGALFPPLAGLASYVATN